MARRTVIVGLCALLLAAPAPAAAEDDLWDRTISLVSANPIRMPGTVHTRMETLDRHGAVKVVEDYWAEMSLGPDGEPVSALVRAEKDGVDITEKAQRQGKKREGRGFELGPESSPFLPENQEQVTVTPREGLEEIDGRRCQGFDLVLTTDQTTYRGIAWIDELNAVPRRYEFTAEPMPPMVQQMQMVLTYRPLHTGGWISEQMVVEGVGGALMVKKRFRVTITFDDHFVVD